MFGCGNSYSSVEPSESVVLFTGRFRVSFTLSCLVVAGVPDEELLNVLFIPVSCLVLLLCCPGSSSSLEKLLDKFRFTPGIIEGGMIGALELGAAASVCVVFNSALPILL